MESQKIIDTPLHIADFIRSTPATPRHTAGNPKTLGEIRGDVEKQLRSSAIKALNIPMGALNKPLLRCWMELS